MSVLPAFPPFVETDNNPGPHWKKWLSRFERLMVALDINSAKRKRALLLHYAGPKVDEIFDTLQETGEDEDYDRAVAALNKYFEPKSNSMYEVYIFRQGKQEPGETLDRFVTRLRQLATNCKFTDVDREITAQVIAHCHSPRLRRQALSKGEDLTLAKLLDIGRALEASEKQAEVLEGAEVNAIQEEKTPQNTAPEAVNTMRGRSFQRNRGRGTGRGRQNRSKSNHFRPHQTQNQRQDNPQHQQQMPRHSNPRGPRPCYFCGGDYPHQTTCPAKGKECITCHKIGHFARVCMSRSKAPKRVNQMQDDHDDDTNNDYSYAVTDRIYSTHDTSRHLPTTNVSIGGHTLNTVIDSGATVNIMDAPTFHRLKTTQKMQLHKAHSRIYPYGSDTPLPVLGVVKVSLQSAHDTSCETEFFVVKSSKGNLLSFNTASKLKLITINNIASSSMTDDRIFKEYATLFEGTGKVKDKKIKLHIDKDIKSKQQKHRRIPFHTRKDVEKELERLEKEDIIEKIDGPTPWVSPIVVVPKPDGQVRICVDMREANQAIQRERHPMPTLDELIEDMNGATVFSTLDLTAGYHQFELDEGSRYITTFSTHVGLRRYKRLMFGVNSASEIFQSAVAELLSGLDGAKNVSDDIIVYGKTQAEHDSRLKATLERLDSHNVKLKKEKCKFSQSCVKFYGHIFNKQGLSPDPKKIEAIIQAEPPENAKEMKSLLGLVSYISRFIPDYASLTAPLRQLTHQDVKWKWEEQEIQAFERLKEVLTNTQTMSYFDPTQPTEVLVDASPAGLGAMLCQNKRPISYASKSLTGPESRYSQTEREMLAVVWGVEHFHLYLYGAQFQVITDHKPLLRIFEKQTPMSARIERWRLRLMQYNCKLVYRPGKDEDNPVDYLSRHPEKANIQTPDTDSQYLNYICTNAVPKAMTLAEVKKATQEDNTLQLLKKAIETTET